jgi:gluconokinase
VSNARVKSGSPVTGAEVARAGAAKAGVVLGVDIGTTSTKTVAYDVTGRAGPAQSVAYPLHEPVPGYAEQDSEVILAAVMETMRAVAAQCTGQLLGISFSSAMHSLIGLDAAGAPLTPSITWADSRASAQAERIRAAAGGLALHQRTGTPIHPMSPLVKLVWFRENAPELCAQVSHWVGIKDYVVWRLCGTLRVDHSLASATGLLDIHRLAWDPEALALAGITADQLPTLAPTTTVVGGLTPAVAAAVGIPASVPIVLGAADGPLANLGLGAVHPGVAACSIGTSGALRVMVEEPGVDPDGGVFCYALTEHRWVVGGAINNGGIVLGWTGDALAPDLGEHPEQQLLDLAASAPPGCGGLVMLPYLLGERAPHWGSVARGTYVGLTREHRREHLVRAALEGVCQQLALVLASMRAAGNDVHTIRATGGFARSPWWRQLLADVLDMEIGFPASAEGSSFGAALLAMDALGLVESIDVAADMVAITDTVRPDPAAAATYRSLRPVLAGLYDALVPAFTSLRDLAPGLPMHPPA